MTRTRSTRPEQPSAKSPQRLELEALLKELSVTARDPRFTTWAVDFWYHPLPEGRWSGYARWMVTRDPDTYGHVTVQGAAGQQAAERVLLAAIKEVLS
jgi:hypothetical protein